MKLPPLVATIVCLGLSASAHAQLSQLSLRQDFTSGPVIGVSANISRISNLKSGDFTIEYDSNHLLFLNASAGSFLSSHNGISFNTFSGFDPITGLDTEEILFDYNSSGSPSGSGDLTDFQFLSLDGFPTTISFGNDFFYTASFFNASGAPIIVRLGRPIVVALPMTDIPEPGEGTFALAALLGGLFTWKIHRRSAKLSRGTRS